MPQEPQLQRSEHPFDVEVCHCGQEMSKHDMSHDPKALSQQPPTTDDSSFVPVEDQIELAKQAADDKQWTLVRRANHFNVMCGSKLIYKGCTSEFQGKFLCNQHNAALATERSRTTAIREADYQDYIAKCKELAAERENVTIATQMVHIESKRANEVEKSLLQAQAAIAEVIRHWNEFGPEQEFEAAIHLLEKVDLSALKRHDREQWKLLIDGQHRAICGKCGYPELVGSDDCRNCGTNFAIRFGYGERHDAEVRKPLVDALESIRNDAIALVDARKYPNSVLHVEAPERIKQKANAAIADAKTASA